MSVTNASSTVLVTGGSAGVGLALARRLLAGGSDVMICARDEARLATVARELAGVRTVVADLSTADGVRTVAEAVSGTLDLLINNAAIQLEQDWPTSDTDELLAAVDAEIGTNLLAPLRLTARLLPRMSETAVIVNITSALAVIPKRSAPGYCAAKAGLRAFSTSLRYQAAPVRVVEAMLPLVDTAMTAGRGRGKISPDAAAKAILAGLNRDVIRIGAVRPLLVLHRLAPRLAARILRDG